MRPSGAAAKPNILTNGLASVDSRTTESITENALAHTVRPRLDWADMVDMVDMVDNGGTSASPNTTVRSVTVGSWFGVSGPAHPAAHNDDSVAPRARSLARVSCLVQCCRRPHASFGRRSAWLERRPSSRRLTPPLRRGRGTQSPGGSLDATVSAFRECLEIGAAAARRPHSLPAPSSADYLSLLVTAHG